MNGLQLRALKLDSPVRIPSAMGAALGILFILPFLVYFRPPPIGDFYTEWLAAVSLAVAVGSAIAIVPRRFSVEWGLLALPLALALIILVQLALGRYIFAYDWALWFAYLGVFALAMILGQGLRSAGLLAEVTDRMAWAIVLTSLLQLFTQLAQLYRMEDAFAPFVVHVMKGSVCRLHGNIGQANQATTMAWFGVAGALYLIETRRLARALGLLVVGMLLVSSALTASRMAWLFGAVVSAAIVWGNPIAQRSIVHRFAGAVALLVAFAAANALASQLIHLQDEACASGLARLTHAEGDSLSIRWNLWRQAFLVWTAHPWFGSGAGNFSSLVYTMDHAPGRQPLDYYAHNSLLQLLAEFGAFGATAAMCFLLFIAWSVFKTRRERDAHRLVLVAWVAIVLTYSMLEFPLWYMHFLIFFGLSVGLLLSPRKGTAVFAARARPMLTVGVTALLVGCAYLAYDYRKAERVFFLLTDSQMLHALGSPELTAAMDKINRTTQIYRVHTEYALGASVPMTKVDVQAKLASNERLLTKIPIAGTITRQVLLLTLAGDLEGARRHVRRLLKFAPATTDEALHDVRRLIKEVPDSFGPLGPILDEELAAAPIRHW